MWWLPLAAGALGSLFNKKPEYGMKADDIDKLIGQFRESGLSGIRSQGLQAQQDSTSQMAASGYEMTPAIQQAILGPIMERLAQARTGLEGNLAQTQAGMQQNAANQNMNADMASWGNKNNLFGGLMDIGGMGFVNKYFPQMGGQNGTINQPNSGGTAQPNYNDLGNWLLKYLNR